MRSDKKGLLFSIVLTITVSINLVSCTTESDSPTDPGIPYTDIDSTTGFTTAYLSQKSFYRPDNYFGNEFIYAYAFMGTTINWSDNLFSNNGSATYSIVSNNGIDGILEYYDGSYTLHYNIHSVEADHIKVCYTYMGIDTVMACDVSQALKWYFDRATAENNYP